ncbi:hypothetical protein OG698_01415 [Streptomyces sp. NBC_01003]|uniref:hypothetical protein n=1 Tax=Streptomyces sp. NBC_01003 TaxID=2903714 RepID=UPI00386FF3CA|nr:hypothetical protein OG698_01415 [Streptomyces sp. NBC_01003]
MGRFRDWRTGTRYPDEGVEPLARSHVEAALLALNGPDKPYRVRTALAEEKADVVAEWHMLEPGWGSGMGRRQVERTFKFRMRLDGGAHDVRVCADVRETTRAGDPPTRVVERRHGKGSRTRVKSWRGSYKKGQDGRRRRVDDFRFDSNDLRDPLQEVVLTSGWTWRGTHKP